MAPFWAYLEFLRSSRNSGKDLEEQRNDEILQVESEISGVRNETKKEQEKSEDLHDKLNKRRKEIEFLTTRMQELKAEKKKLDEQEIMLKNSLQ